MTAVLAEPATTTELDRDELITRWIPLARSLAFDFLARAPRHVDRDDVISAAFLGLVEAAHRYDPNSQVPFPKWAPIRIRGAIADAARAVDPLSKQTRRDVKVVLDAEDRLSQAAPSAVTDAQLATHLGWDVQAIRDARTQFHRALTTSLDATVPGSPTETFAVRLVDADPTPLERLERAELDRYVTDAVQALPDRLRDVLCSYFFANEASSVTAERLGLTQQRVGQLRKEALLMLKEGISAQYREVYDRTAVGAAPPVPANTPAAARQAARMASYAAAVGAQSTFAQRLTL